MMSKHSFGLQNRLHTDPGTDRDASAVAAATTDTECGTGALDRRQPAMTTIIL